MQHRKNLPDLERLKQSFDLTEDGFLIWKDKRPGVTLGAKVGYVSSSDGYMYVGLDRVRYSVHRIVWKLFYGSDPPETLDHIDGNRTNNAPSNLRECSTLENTRNKKKHRSATGHIGIYFSPTKGKYYAQIKDSNKLIHLGTFKSFEEALAARLAAEKKYFGAFAPNNEEIK